MIYSTIFPVRKPNPFATRIAQKASYGGDPVWPVQAPIPLPRTTWRMASLLPRHPPLLDAFCDWNSSQKDLEPPGLHKLKVSCEIQGAFLCRSNPCQPTPRFPFIVQSFFSTWTNDLPTFHQKNNPAPRPIYHIIHNTITTFPHTRDL